MAADSMKKGRAVSRGFTLIELMIAVAILAIIVAIALPSYTNQVVKTNRAEAKTILMQTAQAMERCFTRYSAYNSDDCSVGFPINSETGKYQMPEDEQTIAQSSFTLVAVPQGAQATRDTACGSLSLQHNGTRGITGDATDIDDCW
jgi:type IV pilus assembly protein PilE